MTAREIRLYLAWLMALSATLGSLYFSDIKGFVPCTLCWYQRIAMYPLVVILGIAALRSDLRIRYYALPVAVIGWLISLVQNAEDWGWIKTLKVCTTNPSEGRVACDIPWPIWPGMLGDLNTVITIPVLSMIAFTLIIGLLSWRTPRPNP